MTGRTAALTLAVTALPWFTSPAIGQESISVALLPSSVAFSLASGRSSNPGTLAITVTTTWSVGAGRNQISLDAYFANPDAALLHATPGNPHDIPAARVEARVNAADPQPFNQTVAFGAAGAGRRIFTQALSFLNRTGLRADVVALNINLAGLALAADTYVGTLRLRAQATP